MRITKLKLLFIALAGLTLLAGHLSGGSSQAAAVVDDLTNPHYKGASAFNFVGAAPNVARCGAFPENIELSFEGAGVDTEGGYNTAVFSACTNTTTNRVFDLKAEDTYLNGDKVFIEGDAFNQVINPANCTGSNSHGVNFRVAGGTGAYAGATGGGRFNLFSNLTPCNGQVVPSMVSFEGWIKKAN